MEIEGRRMRWRIEGGLRDMESFGSVMLALLSLVILEGLSVWPREGDGNSAIRSLLQSWSPRILGLVAFDSLYLSSRI